MKLCISGATGRMGRSVARLAHANSEIRIVGASAGPTDPDVGRDVGELAGVGSVGVAVSGDIGGALLGADVVIDFSVPQAFAALCAAAKKQKIAVVSGTTNLDAQAERALEQAAAEIPILWAPNMSLGVQVLSELVEHAVRRLGASWDVEMMEMHHRRKIDAPSGTAKRLLQAARAARNELKPVFGREGEPGARTQDEIGVFALRGGDVVGDHTVFLLGGTERIELTHRASNRDVFAEGALRAASFVVGKAPGRYTIKDVLG